METLKKMFPLSWKYANDVANLIIGIIVYVVFGIIAGALIALSTLIVGWIPVLGAVIGWALRIIASLLGIYILAGIIILILVFAKVIKD